MIIKTPTLDKIMHSLDWKQYNKEPIFYRYTVNNLPKNYIYFITFPTDHYSMYGMYEQAYKDGKISCDNVKQILSEHFIKNNANTYVTKQQLKWALPMLAADFYWHNRDGNKHKYYVDLYEKISGRKY